MFSGYQNKKKKKELADAFEKLSKPAWKSNEKLGSVTKSRDINPQQQESEVSNLRVNPRPKSLVINSAKPATNADKVRKSTSVHDGLECADIDNKSVSTEKALPPDPNSKIQLDEFDTTQLEANIAELAKKAGIDFDITQFEKDNQEETFDSLLSQMNENVKQAYLQRISKESEKTVTANKSLKSLEDNSAWITDTCSQITEKLEQLKNEVKSERMLETNRPQLKENLKLIISDTLKAKDDSWIPNFDELCRRIKSDSQRLHSDIRHICKMFTEVLWEKELRKRAEKCFDTTDPTAFQRMKIDYTTLFNQLFPNHSCSDEFVVACNHLAKSYIFSPPSPKHLTAPASASASAAAAAIANTSENSSTISVPEDSSKRSSPANTFYTLKSKILPPLHFTNKERADMFISNLGQAKLYFQADAMRLYKSYDDHRLIKPNDVSCPCILCEEASKHKHTTGQCNFCNVHQSHNKKNEQDQEHCVCGNCIHFSHYIQGLRFLTDEFADGTKYTASRSSSLFQEQRQQPAKEKKSLNKLIGGLLFDNNSSHKKK